jgi:hypothetical protein
MQSKIKKILLVLIVILITGCSNNKVELPKENNDLEVNNQVKVLIDKKEYTINLEDNETANSFVGLLPQELNMRELNGNEKYIYLDTTLPTNSSNPKRINAGDVMLYGNNCLVIFYKSFDTSYSYSKIGHIDNLPNLGNGSISVKFEK